MVSSASSRPVEIRLTFSSRTVTLAGWPGATLDGAIVRAQRSWYRARRAVSAENSGRQISIAPTLTIGSLPSMSAAITPTMPAVRNDAPRTVNQARTDRIVASLNSLCQCTSPACQRPACAYRPGCARDFPGLAPRQWQALDNLGQHLLG